jgi:hypothetical protein
MQASQIIEISARIAANTAKVNDYLTAQNLPQPSFDANASTHSLIPHTEPEVAAARQAAIHDCGELRDLLLGPREYLINYRHNELLSQHVILRFGLAEAVPIDGEATFAELAAASGLNEVHVRKIVRFATAQHIFREPRPGVVAHTAASRLLVDHRGLRDWLRFSTDDLWQAASRTGDAMAAYLGSEEPGETGYALANRSGKSMYDFFAETPDRLHRFAAAMRFFTERPGLEPHFVVDNYRWGDIVHGGLVVDVGGSHGVVSIQLARRFPGLHFVVQDVDAQVVRDAEQQRPDDVADRVRFMVHDFFLRQPVRGADVYFLRAVLHNWSDKYAVKILQSLVPALKPGARIVLNETVVPEPGSVPPAQAARVRANDLTMLELQNAGDREMMEWERLFTKAHPGFSFKGGRQPEGSALWVLEAEYMGSPV